MAECPLRKLINIMVLRRDRTALSRPTAFLLLFLLSSTWHLANAFAQIRGRSKFNTELLPRLACPRSASRQRSRSRTHSRSSAINTLGNNNNQACCDSVASGPPPPLPTLKQCRNFGLPCLALWIAGPLLSLIDTSFVGLAAGTSEKSVLQLAALGPATTFFDSAIYLFAFLNLATTSLYATACARSGDQSDEAESVVRTSAYVAMRCGLGLMVFLLTCTRPLLKVYMGSNLDHLVDRTMLNLAATYVSIRALTIPTSLLLGVLQAALLGARDSVTPLIAIVYSTLVNVFGDALLVGKLKMGLPGAALATTLAQWSATMALVRVAKQNLVRNRNLGLWKNLKGTENTVTARSYFGFAAPVFALIVCELLLYGFMTHSAAFIPGQPVPLAAHQIILSLLFFCSPFFEVLSQMAQSFLPALSAPVATHIQTERARNPAYQAHKDPLLTPWLNAIRSLATRLMGIGLLVATCMATLVSLVPAAGGFLVTNNPNVLAALRPLAWSLWMGVFSWALVAVAEGILLAQLQLKFLAGVYLVSTLLVPPALLHIKLSATGTVKQIWSVLAILHVVQAILLCGRVWGGIFLDTVLKSRSTNASTFR